MSEEDQDREEPQVEQLPGTGDEAPRVGRPRLTDEERRRRHNEANQRSRERRRAAAAEGSGSGPSSSSSSSPATRASAAAKKGAEFAYGFGGVGLQFAGNVTGSMGAFAAGWVMQAQASTAGPEIAKRALGTRWYPYLERLGKGGDLAPLFIGPVAVFMYCQVPPLRPLLEGVCAQTVGELELDTINPDNGELVHVRIWEQLNRMVAMQAGQAQAAAPDFEPEPPPADQNGSGDFWTPPPDQPASGSEDEAELFNVEGRVQGGGQSTDL